MPDGVKNILCCVAMAPSSGRVLLRALQEAEAHDARVQVLHVIPSFDAAMTTPIVAFIGEDKFRKLVEEHKDEATSAIKAQIISLKEKIMSEHLEGSVDRIAHIHVYEGDPELEILNMTDRLQADMVVLGTHTKGITHHTFMGSVAKKVIRRIKVPVLLVPPVK
ncbi:MAG: universal stress protein [bacterium]|nr:universal stress protein [bacterium]MDT8395347.1 universal stress protein [bacterium]